MKRPFLATTWRLASFVLLAGLAHHSFTDGVSGSGYTGGISKFRSIVIDGIHFNTDEAVVNVNGHEADIEDLYLGQQVYAQVDFEALTASRIDQYDTVRGRIEELTVLDTGLGELSLTVLGQQVTTDLDTVMHIDEVKKVKTGEWVAISGLRGADGVIDATALVFKPDRKNLVLTGFVGAMNGSQIELGSLSIELPYFAEHVADGWLYEGAPIMVELVDYDKDAYGEFVAERVLPVPAELLAGAATDSEAVEEDHIRVDGEVQILDLAAGRLDVAGFEVELLDTTIMHDRRDRIRLFGADELNEDDHVTLSLRLKNGRLLVDKLVREKKVKEYLRAEIQASEDQDAFRLLFREFDASERHKEIRFDGRKLKDYEGDPEDAYRIGNRVELRLKKGEVDKVAIYSPGFRPGRDGKGAQADKSWSP